MRLLKDRWKTADGEQLRQQIIAVLKDNKGLDSINELEKYNGKYDLRGIAFPSHIGETKKTGKLSLTQVERTQFYNTRLANADLSYCDLTLTDFIDSTIDNVYALKGKFIAARFLGTDLSNSIFDECNFEEAMMGLYRHQTNHICKFSNDYFIKSNFKNAHFSIAEYRKVVFDTCKLREVDFDGTMFYDCTFKGELDSVQFYGYRRRSVPALESMKPKVEDYFNQMQNVDFTEAKLLGVGFRQQCDVSTCKFPKSDDYILMPNKPSKLMKVIPLIEKTFRDKERDYYLKIYDFVSQWFEREKSNCFIEDKYGLIKYRTSESVDKYFSILREVIALPDEPEEKQENAWDKVKNIFRS